MYLFSMDFPWYLVSILVSLTTANMHSAGFWTLFTFDLVFFFTGFSMLQLDSKSEIEVSLAFCKLFEDDEVSAFECFHLFCKNGFNYFWNSEIIICIYNSNGYWLLHCTWVVSNWSYWFLSSCYIGVLPRPLQWLKLVSCMAVPDNLYFWNCYLQL